MSNLTGVLLLNLGTPDAPQTAPVRRYLRQFLSDSRVLDIHPIGKWLLLNGIILPFRSSQSAEAYRKIWTDRGSPLLFHTADLTDAVQKNLGSAYSVKFAMRYQSPSLTSVMDAFQAEGVSRILVLPLYPQYASSSTGSCLEELYRIAGSMWNAPALSVVPPFFEHPAFLDALEAVARESMGDLSRFDHYLMSFHGLPERHIRKCDLSPAGKHCLQSDDCCDRAFTFTTYCYRAQAFRTAEALALRLGIPKDRYTVAFQSRLGRTPWIKPYTDLVIKDLPDQGVKRLAVLEPSFTADCLETLEEIAIRGKELFVEAGGEDLELVPSLNAHPAWIDAVTIMLKQALGAPASSTPIAPNV